jgi:hypothetical protein
MKGRSVARRIIHMSRDAEADFYRKLYDYHQTKW